MMMNDQKTTLSGLVAGIIGLVASIAGVVISPDKAQLFSSVAVGIISIGVGVLGYFAKDSLFGKVQEGIQQAEKITEMAKAVPDPEISKAATDINDLLNNLSNQLEQVKTGLNQVKERNQTLQEKVK